MQKGRTVLGTENGLKNYWLMFRFTKKILEAQRLKTCKTLGIFLTSAKRNWLSRKSFLLMSQGYCRKSDIYKQVFEQAFEVFPVKAPPTVGDDDQWVPARSDYGWFGRKASMALDDRPTPPQVDGLARPSASSYDVSPTGRLERHRDALAWARPEANDELQILAPPPTDDDLSSTSSTPSNITVG